MDAREEYDLSAESSGNGFVAPEEERKAAGSDKDGLQD
jgi:hypothetical protein